MEYRSGVTGDPHPGLDIFPDLSPRAKPYCGVKCSQGLHFPATLFIRKQDSRSTSPESNEGMRPRPVKCFNVQINHKDVHMDGEEYNNDPHAKIKKRKNDLVVLNI